MAKKEKISSKELMDSVINLELLEKRKERANKSKKNVEIDIIEDNDKNEEKWFHKPMIREKFSVIEKDDKLYIHYSDWSDRVYIGPYSSTDEVDSIIEMYIKETKKKDLFKRKFKVDQIHSIII
ncbi:MAG: hypothetical protein IKT40_09530 [Bacilli bacterium]|nr:hypothetical protein [Bacilli bacterium]